MIRVILCTNDILWGFTPDDLNSRLTNPRMIGSLRLNLLFLLYHVLCVKAALLPSGTASLSNVSNPLLPSTALNASSSLLQLPTFDPEYFYYDVPDTFRFVAIGIDKDRSIPGKIFTLLISTALEDVRQRLADYGNSPLIPYDNPFEREVRWRGAYIFNLNITGKVEYGMTLLTYDMLEETMFGLQQVLVQPGRFFETNFVIEAEYGTKYGIGHLGVRRYEGR